jgi:hypothetical protein
MIGTAVDMTEQHELTEQLERAEARAEHAVQSLRAKDANAKYEKQVVRPGRIDLRPDRRKLDRRPFPYMQCLAPIYDGQTPSVEMFREVQCRDLSTTGFSYQSAEIPTYRQVLVAFGKQGHLICMVAEIVHVTLVNDNGTELFLIGCKYTGRVTDPK